jgi:hypothetical protein
VANWTTKKVGDAIGVSDRQVRNILAALGITPSEKIGNVPLLSASEVRRVRVYHAKNSKRGPKAKGKK